MKRYFIEVSYKGANYAGFQIQQNANSIQREIEKALSIFFKERFELTGSSRTDAGVNALSNFFHFDSIALNSFSPIRLAKAVYNINAILPRDIVAKRVYEVAGDAHCRFDAISREYKYFLYQYKDPFQADRAYYYPYHLDMALLQQAAEAVLGTHDFVAFAKRNTQVHTHECTVEVSGWVQNKQGLEYTVRANRFLRGMVRGFVGTMLKVGTGKMSIDQFRDRLNQGDNILTDFSVPPQGLFLVQVNFAGL